MWIVTEFAATLLVPVYGPVESFDVRNKGNTGVYDGERKWEKKQRGGGVGVDRGGKGGPVPISLIFCFRLAGGDP